MTDKKPLPRRALLQNLTGVAALTTASSSIVGASSDADDYPPGKFVKRIRDEYSTNEAKIIIKTASRYASKVRRGDATPHEALAQCNEALVENEEAEEITEDIQETRQFRRRLSNTTTKSTDSQATALSVSANDITTQATKSVPVSRYEYNFSYYGAGNSDYRGSPGASPPSMEELAEAFFYGGATTTVKLFGRFTTASGTSGPVELSSRYFRF
jgi:hypothetical protein